MRARQDHRRRVLAQRRRCPGPHRRLTVEYLGDGKFRYRCKTCRRTHTLVQRLPDGSLPFGGNVKMIERFMVRYRNGTDDKGVTGKCPHCTKRARDARWPLPEAT